MARGASAIAPRFFSLKATQGSATSMCSLCSLWLKQTDPPSPTTYAKATAAALRAMAVKTVVKRLRRTGRKQTMIKTEINETRTKLVRTILAIKRLKTQKTALTKALEPDFEAHEAEYRNGVKTDAGVLVRKPKWNFDAKPVVEVAG